MNNRWHRASRVLSSARRIPIAAVAAMGMLSATAVPSAVAVPPPAPSYEYYLIEYTDIGPDSTSTAAIEAGMTGAAWVELREIDRPGINKPIGPRTLRHAFITAALDAGVPLRDVQEAASHADPRTTMRYDRARVSLDRHATYIVATFIAGASR